MLARKNGKDVADLLRLLETYGGARNEARIRDEEEEDLQSAGYDMVLAGVLARKGCPPINFDRDTEAACERAVDNKRNDLIRRLIWNKSTLEDHTGRVTALFEAQASLDLHNIETQSTCCRRADSPYQLAVAVELSFNTCCVVVPPHDVFPSANTKSYIP